MNSPFTPGFGGVGVAHLFRFLCCDLFVFVLCLVVQMLPVSLNSPFLIAPSVFSNVYLFVYVMWPYQVMFVSFNSNTTNVTSGAETAHPSETFDVTPGY
jgi:hypothetical protein